MKLKNKLFGMAVLVGLASFSPCQSTGYSRGKQGALEIIVDNSYENIEKPYILIDKSDSKLYFISNEGITEYKVAFGYIPGKKEKFGDGKTPEGEYYICNKQPSRKFHKFIGVSYPNIEDAEIGLKKELINEKEYNLIVSQIEHKKCPLGNTYLGGAIGIHGEKKIKILGFEFGIGTLFNWTRGCIATTNSNIDGLYKKIPYGTMVIIQK